MRGFNQITPELTFTDISHGALDPFDYGADADIAVATGNMMNKPALGLAPERKRKSVGACP